MNIRLTAILFGVVLLLVVGLLVGTLVDDGPATDTALFGPLEGLKPADIDVVEISRIEPAEKLVFARTGKDRWELREPSAGRADSALITRIITDLLKLKPIVSKDVTADPARHGLDTPGLSITLRAGTKAAPLHIGDTTLGGDSATTFVATGDRPNVPLAVKRGDLLNVFKDDAKEGKSSANARTLSGYRLKRLLGVDMFNAVDSAKSLKIRAAGKDLHLVHEGSEWKFAAPAGYGLVDLAGDPAPNPNAITGLRGLIGTLNGLAAAGPEDFIEAPEPPAKYGLAADDPNLVRIELAPKDGPPDVILFGKKIEGLGPVKYYAQVPGEGCVVKVATDRIDSIITTVKDPRPLQDRTLIKDLDVPRIDAVTITAGGTVANLRKVPYNGQPQWVLYGGANDPQPAGDAIATLLQELAVPRVALEVVPGGNDAAFAPAEVMAVLQVYVDGFEKKPEAKAGAFPDEPKLKATPTVTLTIGKTDGDAAFVRRTLADGVKVDLKIAAPLAVKASRKRLDYLDLKFKEFASNTAKKLTFNRGAEVFEIVKAEKPESDFPLGKWTFAKPESLKGQIADLDKIGSGTSLGAGLIGTLATLSATSVVTETPTDAEVKAWQLEITAPRMKATVELDGPEKSREFHFGTETTDKANVYFRPLGVPTVYLVPRVSVDSFFTQDLRDRTPYRIDITNVKSVRVRWWKAKQVTETTFDRDGTNPNLWTEKGKTVKADPIQMQNLLNHLRAPKPLAVVGAVAKEHGFGAGDADPVEVALFDATGQPLANVTIGNETDGGAAIFFWNAATKDVCTLPAALYKPFKAGPEGIKAK